MELQLGRRPTRFWESWVPLNEERREGNIYKNSLWAKERIRNRGEKRSSKGMAEKLMDKDMVLMDASTQTEAIHLLNRVKSKSH